MTTSDRFDRLMTGVQDYMDWARQRGSRKLDAELPAGCEGKWYLLRSDREVSAAAGLAGRGFGVYLPMKRAVVLVRGRKETASEPLFRGWIFLWVRDLPRQLSKIRAVLGVIDVLRVRGEPFVVPAVEVTSMQAQEFEHDGVFAGQLERIMDDGSTRTHRGRRGGRKHKRRTERKAQADAGLKPLIRCYSAFGDPNERNKALFKALGLDSTPEFQSVG